MVLVRYWELEVAAPEASGALHWLTEHGLHGHDHSHISVNCDAMVLKTLVVCDGTITIMDQP